MSIELHEDYKVSLQGIEELTTMFIRQFGIIEEKELNRNQQDLPESDQKNKPVLDLKTLSKLLPFVIDDINKFLVSLGLEEIIKNIHFQSEPDVIPLVGLLDYLFAIKTDITNQAVYSQIDNSNEMIEIMTHLAEIRPLLAVIRMSSLRFAGQDPKTLTTEELFTYLLTSPMIFLNVPIPIRSKYKLLVQKLKIRVLAKPES